MGSASSQPSQGQQQEQSLKHAAAESDQSQPFEKLRKRLSVIWNRTWGDPVAFYTFVLSIFTGLLVAVSVVQFYFLFRADKTARIAAEAARDQAVLTRQAMVNTQRAFVLIKNLEREPLTELYQAPTGPLIDRVIAWRIGVVWGNSGDTPTRNLLIHISHKFFDGDMPRDFDFPNLSEVAGNKALIGPQGYIYSPSFIVTLQEAQSVRTGTKSLYMWGWAEYEDVFSGTPRHRTEFCFQFFFEDPFPRNTSLGHRLHGTHNGADDECLKPIQTKSGKKA